MVGARSFTGNPLTATSFLAEQLEQVTILTEDTGRSPSRWSRSNFRGVDAHNPGR